MDPFAIFGIPRGFDVDLAALDRRHRELSKTLHPDKFAGAPPSERRAALSKACEVNEAWRVLRDPVRRAEALFELSGIPVGEDNEPKPDPDFLMEMMEQREALAEARRHKNSESVRSLAEGIARKTALAEDELGRGFADALVSNGSGRAKLAKLVGKLGELRFYRRFLDEASVVLDELGG